MSESTKDMLAGQMERALRRITRPLEVLDHGWPDNASDLDPDMREYLEDLGLEFDPEDPDYYNDIEAEDRVRDDLLDVLEITYEKGEPFSVTLACGGPNIFLVDMGGFGGPQLRGYWGFEDVVRTGAEVRRAVEFYREYMEESDY